MKNRIALFLRFFGVPPVRSVHREHADLSRRRAHMDNCSSCSTADREGGMPVLPGRLWQDHQSLIKPRSPATLERIPRFLASAHRAAIGASAERLWLPLLDQARAYRLVRPLMPKVPIQSGGTANMVSIAPTYGSRELTSPTGFGRPNKIVKRTNRGRVAIRQLWGRNQSVRFRHKSAKNCRSACDLFTVIMVSKLPILSGSVKSHD